MYWDYSDGAKLKKTSMDRFVMKELTYANIHRYLGVTRTELRNLYNSHEVLKLQTMASVISEIEAEELEKLGKGK